MLYTDATKKAMKLCFEAHKYQTDKSGIPYVFHPIARAVKLADLAHNSDLTRLDTVDENALSRTAKYQQAIALLRER